MNGLLKKIFGRKLTPYALWNAGSVAIRIVASYFSNKIVVWYLGPAGTALTEQARNFLETVRGTVTLGVNQGVINYTAVYSERPKRLINFLASVYRLVLFSSLVIAGLLMVFAPKISMYLFKTGNYTFIIYAFAFFTPVYAYQSILLAVLNGLEQYRRISVFNAFIHITGTILTAVLVVKMHYTGALLSIALTPVTVMGILILQLGKDSKILLNKPLHYMRINGLHKNNFKRLFPYIIMSFVVAIVIPVGHILIRNLIIDFYGTAGKIHAGYWDAIRKISSFALMFIAPLYGMFYLPQLAKVKSGSQWRKLIAEMVKYVYFPFILMLIVIYLFRNFFTLFVFSEEYNPVNQYYFWQFTGDIIKIFSLLIAYKMWVKRTVNLFVFSEISYWILYYLLSKYFIDIQGITGVIKAYAAANVYYLSLMILAFRKDLLQ